MRLLAFLVASCACVCAQTKSVWNDLPAYTMSNGLLEVTVLSTGGTLASVTLAGDADKLNPLWDPVRFARETSTPYRGNGSGVGHFLCLDGFGGTSAEERSAGFPGHGEAHRRPFETKVARSENGAHVLTLETELPMAQERVTRTFEIRQGESVVYVRTQLQSLLAFDRPISWAEHGTIGSPFLEPGVTVVDTPAKKAQTRPYTASQQRRLAPGKDFDWPMAPLVDGKLVDIRSAPVKLGSGDHTTQVMDPARTYAYATALHPQKRLIVGWIWRTADFPWLQSWKVIRPMGSSREGWSFPRSHTTFPAATLSTCTGCSALRRTSGFRPRARSRRHLFFSTARLRKG